jgi:hypothetical protein
MAPITVRLPESVRNKFHNFNSAFPYGTAATENSAAMAADTSLNAALATPVTGSAAVTFPLAKAPPTLSPGWPRLDDLR